MKSKRGNRSHGSRMVVRRGALLRLVFRGLEKPVPAQNLSKKSPRTARARNELRQQIHLTVAQARAYLTHDLEMLLVRIRDAPLARHPHALSNERRQRGIGRGIEQRESFFD